MPALPRRSHLPGRRGPCPRRANRCRPSLARRSAHPFGRCPQRLLATACGIGNGDGIRRRDPRRSRTRRRDRRGRAPEPASRGRVDAAWISERSSRPSTGPLRPTSCGPLARRPSWPAPSPSAGLPTNSCAPSVCALGGVPPRQPAPAGWRASPTENAKSLSSSQAGRAIPRSRRRCSCPARRSNATYRTSSPRPGFATVPNWQPSLPTSALRLASERAACAGSADQRPGGDMA